MPVFISAVRDHTQVDPFHTITDPVPVGVPDILRPPWVYLLSKYVRKFDIPRVIADRPDLLRVKLPLELLQEALLT